MDVGDGAWGALEALQQLVLQRPDLERADLQRHLIDGRPGQRAVGEDAEVVRHAVGLDPVDGGAVAVEERAVVAAHLGAPQRRAAGPIADAVEVVAGEVVGEAAQVEGRRLLLAALLELDGQALVRGLGERGAVAARLPLGAVDRGDPALGTGDGDLPSAPLAGAEDVVARVPVEVGLHPGRLERRLAGRLGARRREHQKAQQNGCHQPCERRHQSRGARGSLLHHAASVDAIANRGDLKPESQSHWQRGGRRQSQSSALISEARSGGPAPSRAGLPRSTREITRSGRCSSL